MEVVTRQEAKELGLSRYFTGEPCSRGHIATRNTKNGNCHLCIAENKKANREELNRKQREARRADPERERQRKAAHYEKHREAEREKARARYWANPDRRRAYAREYAQRPEIAARILDYRIANKERLAESRRANVRRRLSSDIRYRLNAIIRARLWQLLQGRKNARTHELLGYSMDELIQHIERQFVRGMSWANYGKAWHIDHIIPLASFSFSSTDDREFKTAWGLPNLRPLWAEKNRAKRDRLETLL